MARTGLIETPDSWRTGSQNGSQPRLRENDRWKSPWPLPVDLLPRSPENRSDVRVLRRQPDHQFCLARDDVHELLLKYRMVFVPAVDLRFTRHQERSRCRFILTRQYCAAVKLIQMNPKSGLTKGLLPEIMSENWDGLIEKAEYQLSGSANLVSIRVLPDDGSRIQFSPALRGVLLARVDCRRHSPARPIVHAFRRVSILMKRPERARGKVVPRAS
jgi:hypothetical protein